MSSSLTKKVCFNSNCKEPSEKWRNGWRRRTGEYAHLCDRCASAYEEGKFCEVFHSSTSGWRCCESCGKQIHCGCIVSFHMFVLLDAGGIECLTCAKKSYILTPNPAWPPPSQFLPSQIDRRKDVSVKMLSSIIGSGPVPWRIAPTLFKDSNIQPDPHQKLPFEIDVSGGSDLFGKSERLPAASPEERQEFSDDRSFNGKLRVGPYETFQNGRTVLNPKDQPIFSINNVQPAVFPKYNSSNLSLASISSSKTEIDDTSLLSVTFSPPSTLSIPVGRQVGNHYRMDSFGETQVRNGKVQVDCRGRNQLLPRYRPHITEGELLQISSYSKSAIIPLFEKTLSASDAGRIGRLVLPKKCAEVYFPSIAQPEGLPLKVLDMKGKEWVFQYRFWPNNNSRMYVLEGITPCIQSLRLQAGDVVTFSRLEPEGTLVMGGRKSSSIPSPDQGDGAIIKDNYAVMLGNDQSKNKCVEGISINGYMKSKSQSSFLPISHTSKAVTGNDSEIPEAKPPICCKKKGGCISVSKSKRLRIENDIELKLSMEEAQGLMRPPAKYVPSVVFIEGCEFEEFEELAPVIGRPCIPAIDSLGKKIQWVQCEDCFQWRKVPEEFLLPSRWTCSKNVSDLDRSRCSDAEELAIEKLEDILPDINRSRLSLSKKRQSTTMDADLFVAQEELDTLASLAIQEKLKRIPASPDSRSKQPQVLCQKRSKHKQSCDCTICSSLKHRFRTLMERYEKHQLEESESASQKSQRQQLLEEAHSVDTQIVTSTGSVNPTHGEARNTVCSDYHKHQMSSSSSLKGQIDLNIQPEREEDSSPVSEFGSIKQLHPRAAEKFFLQQMPSGSGIQNLVRTRLQQDGIGGGNLISCVTVDGRNQEN